jgi:S-adenosylmethionine:tRNA ribosyltransferase-isomerase
MDVSEFDFALPPELIAQQPSPDRSAARLMTLDRVSGRIGHSTVADLPNLLRAGDLMVVNNTRVFPARLLGRRVPSGGAVECLLVSQRDRSAADGPYEATWEALMHPGQKLKPGAQVIFEGAKTIHGEVRERLFFGRRLVRLRVDDGSSLDAAIDAIGHVPLPPYIQRADSGADRDRYQTVFAQHRGSVAAPTAGLHFTPALLAALSARGVERAEITLHVGYGTFQPVRVARVEDHRVEAERYTVGEDAAASIERARIERRRVIAVGTTTTRTLEAIALAHTGRVVAGSGETNLFIHPGFTFAVVSGLLTNFHLPRSSLLMLVTALGGIDSVLNAYRVAIEERYRFYSYGDAMLVV